MKKTLPILILCSILLLMPLSTGLQIQTASTQTQKQTLVEKVLQPTPLDDEPPSWANGNFSGVWGLDIWGEAHIPLGVMYGYYGNMNFGVFLGEFRNYWEENASGYLRGLFFGPIMAGGLGNVSNVGNYENETIFVGIGRYNETNFHWRIMGESGPTFFMKGTYTAFP